MDTTVADAKTEAVRLIGKYCGVQTASLFLMHYKDKPDDVIKQSVKKIMVDMVGEDRAGIELKDAGLLTT